MFKKIIQTLFGPTPQPSPISYGKLGEYNYDFGSDLWCAKAVINNEEISFYVLDSDEPLPEYMNQADFIFENYDIFQNNLLAFLESAINTNPILKNELSGLAIESFHLGSFKSPKIGDVYLKSSKGQCSNKQWLANFEGLEIKGIC